MEAVGRTRSKNNTRTPNSANSSGDWTGRRSAQARHPNRPPSPSSAVVWPASPSSGAGSSKNFGRLPRGRPRQKNASKQSRPWDSTSPGRAFFLFTKNRPNLFFEGGILFGLYVLLDVYGFEHHPSPVSSTGQALKLPQPLFGKEGWQTGGGKKDKSKVRV